MTGARSSGRRASARSASQAIPTWTHIAWAQALDLNFPLLSDWNKEAMKAFGVEGEFRGHGGVADRTAFLVDEDGTVRGAWRYDTAEVPDFDELVRAAQAM